MTCPVCLSPMLKAERRPDVVAPSRVRCTQCSFQHIFRGASRSHERRRNTDDLDQAA